MDLPSGDHAIGEAGDPGGWLIGSVQVPEVRRLGCPPFAGTSHRCVGSAAARTRKSSLPTSKESLWRSSPVFLGASSEAANAMRLPSGLHENCCTPAPIFVSCVESPPFIGMTKICGLASVPCARNASRSPKGDQRGKL